MQRFADKFPLTEGPDDLSIAALLTGQDLVSKLGGTVLAGGFFRIYTAPQAASLVAVVNETFPQYAGRFQVFGGDWLGRLWVTDSVDQTEEGAPAVCLVHPREGVLDVPGPLTGLFDLLTDLSAQLFMPDVFSEWRSRSSTALPWNTCLSLKVPEILGGQYVVANLEVCDLEVDWSVTSQILEQLADVPEGTRVEVRKAVD